MTNDAAERLRQDAEEAERFVDAIRAARRDERRATVERIRAALDEAMQPYGAIDDAFKPEVFAILDAEAER